MAEIIFLDNEIPNGIRKPRKEYGLAESRTAALCLAAATAKEVSYTSDQPRLERMSQNKQKTNSVALSPQANYTD
jgi:hypothetical protein